MQSSFDITQNDTSPSIGWALPSGVNVVAATVVFSMRPRRSETPVINRAAARIVTTTPPVVAYDWQDGDTAETGFFLAEFELTYADGAVETFPRGSGIPVTITQEIG
jgi:hypothetical protein